MYFETTFLALLDEIADAVPQAVTPRAHRYAYLTHVAAWLDVGAVLGPLAQRPAEPPEVAGGTPTLLLALERSGVLPVDDHREMVWFLHLTFQEFCLARAWEGRPFRETLEERWADVRTEEALALLASHLTTIGRHSEVWDGLRWLMEHGARLHADDPEVLLRVGGVRRAPRSGC